MSKYYKAEDLQKALIGFIRRTGIVELPYDYATDVLDSLPTIEVSEDCISRADLIESFLADSECKREEAKSCMCSLDLMLELIEDAPSVVPSRAEGDVEIVRCEDCIYYSKNELGFRKCTQSGLHVTYDDYCSYGERREE